MNPPSNIGGSLAQSAPLKPGAISPERCAQIATYACYFAMAMGVMVIIGWIFDIRSLMSLVPGLVAMKPNTAVGLCLASSSLLLFARPDPLSKQVSVWLGAAVAAIGALTLVEYTNGVDFGIDELLFRDFEARKGSYFPGRMARISTVNFFGFGIALLLLHAGRARFAHSLAVAITLISLLPIIGYWYGVPSLYAAGKSTAVALHTALAFVALCLALWCFTSRVGFMRVITGHDMSARLVRRCGALAFCSPLLIGWLGEVGERHGLYGARLGLALCALLNTVAIAVLIRIAAARLSGSEAKRGRAEEDLRKAHHELEQRVEERTKDLAEANLALQMQVSERRRAEHAHQLIMDHSLDVICTMDREGCFLQVSRAAEALWGWTAEELIGRPYLDLVHEEDKERTIEVAARIMGGEAVTDFENRYMRPDQTIVPVLWTATWSEAHGLMFCVARDITARKQVEQDLRRAKETAEEANRAKSEFLANMSHEIRTPMNGILGMTELVLDTDLEPQQREYLDMAKSSAFSLLGLINDILDFSKIEARKLELEAISFSLREAVGVMLKPLGMRADQKGLELNVDIRPDVPDHLIGDSLRLRQVLINLTSNAIKFTEHGHVLVQIKAESGAAGEPLLHFSVTDTGIGIPAEKQETIFEAFAQADGSTTRTYGGTGLGLAISSDLVRKMGGRIWVESEVGKGTTFHFTALLPVSEEPASLSTPAGLNRLHGLRALVVDDSALNRRILSEMLTNWGVIATAVEDGTAALREMLCAARASNPYPLVLVDGVMPGMDGFSLAQEIRHQPEISGSVVMMLSSAAPPRAAARCRELGVASFLTKPVCQSELLNSMLMALHNELPVCHAPAAPPRPKNSSPGLRILVAEDNLINRALASGFLHKQGHSLVHAANGREAVEKATTGSFDLILMDVQMPEIDGFEATRQIREVQQQTQVRIPIVAMTAHAMSGDRERCLAAGMDDYISKPLHKATLSEVIARCCPNGSAANTLHAQVTEVPFEQRPSPDDQVFPIHSRQRLLEEVGDDGVLLDRMTSLFLSTTPPMMEELRAAAAAGSPSGVARAAHALLSSLGVFGARSAHQLASHIEKQAASGSLKNATREIEDLDRAISQIYSALRTQVAVPASALGREDLRESAA